MLDCVHGECDADTYVRGGSYADDNYGNASRLIIKDASDKYTRQSYLRFPAAGALSSERVYLRLYVERLPNGEPVTFSVGAADFAWGEYTLTWNNRSQTTGVAHQTQTINAPGWVEFDVTDLYDQMQANGAGDVSLHLFSNAGDNKMIEISSRETNDAPYLEIR